MPEQQILTTRQPGLDERPKLLEAPSLPVDAKLTTSWVRRPNGWQTFVAHVSPKYKRGPGNRRDPGRRGRPRHRVLTPSAAAGGAILRLAERNAMPRVNPLSDTNRDKFSSPVFEAVCRDGCGRSVIVVQHKITSEYVVYGPEYELRGHHFRRANAPSFPRAVAAFQQAAVEMFELGKRSAQQASPPLGPSEFSGDLSF